MNRCSTPQQGTPVVVAVPPQTAKIIDLRAWGRPGSGDTLASRRAHRKPTWIWLYALLPLNFLLFALADLVPTASLWSYFTESAAVLLLVGAAALWVRMNCRTLMVARSDRGSDDRNLHATPNGPSVLPLTHP